MRLVKFALIVCIGLILIFGAYQIISLHKQVQELETQTTSAQPEQVVIYLVKSEPTSFHLVPVTRQIGGPASPTSAMQALLNGPLAHEDLYAAVPPTTKLLNLSVQEGLATANFSQEIMTDFNGGSLLESYLVQAIVNTLTEFNHIQRVQILVEGQAVESIGGHILITHPLAREN